MNPNEHELQYPWAEAPATGAWVTLRPGLHWVRMPLPFALDHINLWVLDDEIEGRPGFTIVDSGISSDATRSAWETIFDGLFAGRPLLRQVCTHFHPDHFGLAHWLTRGGERARWQAPLWMTATEYAIGRLLSAGGGDTSGEGAALHFQRNGLGDEEALAKVRARGAGYYPKLVPAVPPVLSPTARRRRDRRRTGAREARVPHRRRLRSFARARVALLRRGSSADRR